MARKPTAISNNFVLCDDGSCTEYYGGPDAFVKFAEKIYNEGKYDGYEEGRWDGYKEKDSVYIL